jgi:basic membrane protein A
MLVLLVVVVIALSACNRGEDDGDTAEAEPDYQIGIAFDVGGRGDRSFNDSAYRGLRMVAEEYEGYIDGDPDDVDYGNALELKYLEPKEGGQDREQLLRVLAEDGYDLLYGVGFAYTDSLAKVAGEFPETHFVLIDGFVEGLDAESNITCISFAEHEGSFLVGALAGMYLDDSDAKLGFLGGMDIPLIHKFHGGFMAGAMYVNESLRADGAILGQYIGQDPTAFADPQTAENIARTMYNNGAEIVYHASGNSGSGLFKAANDLDKWAIGVDSDQGLIYATSENEQEQAIAEHILTSMLKRVDQSVFLVAQDFLGNDGSVDGGYRTFGLVDGGVGYAVNDYNSEVIAPYTDRLDELKQMVIDGEITVPDHDDKIADWASSTF